MFVSAETERSLYDKSLEHDCPLWTSQCWSVVIFTTELPACHASQLPLTPQ